MDVNTEALKWQKHFEEKPTDVIQMLSVALALLGVEYVGRDEEAGTSAPKQSEES